jgi:hypothetical protein
VRWVDGSIARRAPRKSESRSPDGIRPVCFWCRLNVDFGPEADVRGGRLPAKSGSRACYHIAAITPTDSTDGAVSLFVPIFSVSKIQKLAPSFFVINKILGFQLRCYPAIVPYKITVLHRAAELSESQ